MSAKPSNPAPAAPAQVKLTAEQRALVDEFGELDRKYRLAKPDLDRYEKLKHVIKPWFSELPGDQAATAEGNLYTLQVTACEVERTPDKRKIYRLVGPKLFLEIADVTQKAVKAALESLNKASEFAKLYSEARTGSRTLAAVAKAPTLIAEKKAA